MPRVTLKWSAGAFGDLVRLRGFLLPKSSVAASRAVATIRAGVKILATHPEIGRPVEEMAPEFREWLIEFGQSAYVVLYHYEGKQIVILAIRHGREVGY
jgi:plasmid stabilization system protein ParE